MTRHMVVTRDTPRSSRVSHATHTTPHHTMSLVARFCGVSGQSIHPSSRSLRAAAASWDGSLRDQSAGV